VKSLHNVSSTEVARSQALERLWSLVAVLGDEMQTGLAERGLTLARAELVWVLQLNGPSTQRSLSRALRVTPRNVTGLVDGLEAVGIVARTAHPSDRRATLVTLTHKGATLARAMRRDQDSAAQDLFDGVSAADLASFTRTLDRVLARINEVRP
jgi:DNA-binding MarR family transcriptional regulator